MTFDDFIQANGRQVHRDAGAHLFRQGDRDERLYLVQSGVLKAYYLSVDGKEHIKSFLLPGDIIGSLMASHAGQPSTFGLVCLKPSRLVAVAFRDLHAASRADPEISAEVVSFLIGFGLKKEMREYELLCLTAEQRYERLLERAPEIADLVTQNDIARYLGITPVGLSRIKKRLQAKGDPARG